MLACAGMGANGPYRFSDTLIGVLEAVAKAGSEFARTEIAIAPDALEIALPRIEQPSPQRCGCSGARLLPRARANSGAAAPASRD